jgi:hypothetical protein
MTLPASGQISMSQVRTELGASGQISLGQTSVRTLAGVASGTISLNNLHGKSAASLVDQIPDSAGSGGGLFGSANVQFQTNGTAYDVESATSGKWYDPLTTGIGSSYWIRATVDTAPAGDGVVGGIVGAGWLQITSTRTIGMSITTSEFTYNSDTCVIKVEFAASSGGTVLLTAYVGLSAEAYGNV